MTEQERRDAFVQAINEASQRYGFALEVGLSKEELGSALLVKPMITIVPAQGWQPPREAEEVASPNGHAKGHA